MYLVVYIVDAPKTKEFLPSVSGRKIVVKTISNIEDKLSSIFDIVLISSKLKT